MLLLAHKLPSSCQQPCERRETPTRVESPPQLACVLACLIACCPSVWLFLLCLSNLKLLRFSSLTPHPISLCLPSLSLSLLSPISASLPLPSRPHSLSARKLNPPAFRPPYLLLASLARSKKSPLSPPNPALLVCAQRQNHQKINSLFDHRRYCTSIAPLRLDTDSIQFRGEICPGHAHQLVHHGGQDGSVQAGGAWRWWCRQDRVNNSAVLTTLRRDCEYLHHASSFLVPAPSPRVRIAFPQSVSFRFVG